MIVALFQRVEEVAERKNLDVTRFFEACYPRSERVGLPTGERGVRAIRGLHAKAGVRCRIDRTMMRQIVARIVRRADGADFEFSQDALGCEVG